MLGFRVFGVLDLGFSVWGFGFRVLGLGFRVVGAFQGFQLLFLIVSSSCSQLLLRFLVVSESSPIGFEV